MKFLTTYSLVTKRDESDPSEILKETPLAYIIFKMAPDCDARDASQLLLNLLPIYKITSKITALIEKVKYI